MNIQGLTVPVLRRQCNRGFAQMLQRLIALLKGHERKGVNSYHEI